MKRTSTKFVDGELKLYVRNDAHLRSVYLAFRRDLGMSRKDANLIVFGIALSLDVMEKA